MNGPLHIVHAAFEDLIWLVFVVVAIISQMVKNAREQKSRPKPRPRSPLSPEPAREPPVVKTEGQQELEDFLKDLARTANEAVEPEPAPAPPPPPLPTQPEPVVLEAPAPVVFERPVTPAYASVDVASLRGISHRRFHVERLRQALGTDLINRRTLQKAILLQEVLGKPIGLRENYGGTLT